MTYLVRVLLLALLGSAIAAEDPVPVDNVQTNHKVRLIRPRGEGIPVYEKGAQLDVIFNGDVNIFIENNGTAPITVSYEAFVDSRCYANGSETSLGAAQSVEVPAGGVNVTLSTLSMPDLVLSCGPACLFVNVTGGDKLPGVGRAPLLSKCDNKNVDLELITSLDESQSYTIELGKSLVDQLPALNDVKVKNLGPDDMPQRATELAQSVLVFVRTHVYSQKDYVDKITKTCAQEAEEWAEEYTTTAPPPAQPGRRKRSLYRNKRSGDAPAGYGSDPSGYGPDPSGYGPDPSGYGSDPSGYGPDPSGEGLDLYKMYEMWVDDAQRKIRLREEDVPMCLNKVYGMYDRDVPLVGGDVIVEGSLAVDDEVAVNLTNVKLEAYRKSLCTEKTRVPYAAGNMHQAQLFVAADPLGMNNDTDLCNNVVMVNITYDCTGFEPNEYEMEQCDVVSDPMARGHVAAIFHRGNAVLYFNGKNVEQLKTDDEECQELEYYTKLIEINRWQLLALRLQRIAEANPQVCKVAESYEKVKDRMLMAQAKSGEAKKRRKRDVGGPGGPGLQVDSEKLLAMLMEIATQAADSSIDEQKAHKLYCNFTNGITFRYSILGGDSLPEDDALRIAYKEASDKIDELDSAHGLVEKGCDDFIDDSGLDKWIPDDSGDSLVDDAFGDVLQDIEEKKSRKDGLEEADFDTQKGFIMSLLKDANTTCPGTRGRTALAALTNKTELAADLVEKAVGALYESPMAAPLSDSSCGRRLLDAFIERGAARFINHDLRKVIQPYTEIDNDILLLRYLKFAAEIVGENDGMYDFSFEDFMDAINAKMYDAMMADEERCADKSAILEKFYQADDTYSVFWTMKDGKIYRGVPNIFDKHFGTDDGGERSFLWTQVATCTCKNCHQMYDPEWQKMFEGGGSDYQGGYNYNGDYSSYPTPTYNDASPTTKASQKG